MDHQPRYNRILGYEPESNRATFELAPGQYGSVGVINCARVSAQDPSMPEYTKISGSQWHSGRSIRVNRLGDQTPTVTQSDSRGVIHRNCMWFDVEIDKQYLDDIAATHVDTILRGNISDNMVHSSIWFPVSGGAPDFTGPNTVISNERPENPLNPDNGGPTIWIQTLEPATGGDVDVPIAIWSYSKVIEYVGTPGQPDYEVRTWAWELIYGTENSQGFYNTTTINDIPTYVFNNDKQCRFVVQVHWNQNFAHTATDREVALYVFKGDTDQTRSLDDYIVKSPIVRMRNQANPGPPPPKQPTQKGFKPAEAFDFYDDPRVKNLMIPITNTEIVMDVLSGTATIDPNEEYENAVFVDVIGEDARFTLYYGPGTEVWVMAPTGSGNFPYYIGGTPEQVPPGSGNYERVPTQTEGVLQLSGAGRYAIYGADAILPQTPEITQWCEDNDFPPPDYQPEGVVTDHTVAGMLENTSELTNITSWEGILLTTGRRMFKNVTGDFNLPEYQTIRDLTETFANTPDFTDPGNALNTWMVNTVTRAEGTFDGARVFNSDISSWQMGNVTTMKRMFSNTTIFNQDISSWDVSNVTNMIEMFMGASVFDQFLAIWDVSNIPNKPPNFDTGTTPEWEEFEKPWWGASDRPITSDYVIFHTTKPKLMIRPDGPDSNLQIFKVENRSYLGTFTNGQACLCGTGHIAVFGYANGIRLWNRDIADNLNLDVKTHYNEFDYIHYGLDNSSESFDGQMLESVNHITSDNVDSDINNHISFTGNAETLRTLSTDNVFGTEHRFDDWHKIFGGMSMSAFWALGRLPDGLPDDLIFGWSDMPEPEEYLNRAFSQTSNIPECDGWQFTHNDITPNLTRTFSYVDMTSDLYKAFNKILSEHNNASHLEIFWGSNLSLGGGVDNTNLSHQVTSLEGAYSHTLIDNTKSLNQLTDCDLSLCVNYNEMFINARSDTPHFVEDITINIATGATFRYTFAKTTCVPVDCSWNMSAVSDITGMFYDSVFPDVLDNWDLSNLDSEINNAQGYLNVPCQKHGYVFTGCSGSPTSMTNWQLPPPKALVSDTNFNPVTIDSKYGEFYILDSRYSDTVIYQDVLIPWWFAGCSDFNSDISSWQTTPVVHDQPIQSVRLGTFAYATNFNSQIDWYYPDSEYYDLEFIRKRTHQYNVNLFSSQWLKTRLKTHLNPETKKHDSVEYGRGAQKHTWWHTFLGAESYNNGGGSIPTICANDMVDTFRFSGIDTNITIRKPVWGHGYYQGVFRDTQAWTGAKVIDFECQNRSDHPELINIYFHSIFAERMFRDSNFGGTLGSGFKWFWFNVTNIAGTLRMKSGIDREYSGWNNLSERNSTDATDISTTQLGTLRAPVGNVTDTDSDIEQDTGADLSQGEQGRVCINNSALYDITAPPRRFRKMFQYCIGRPWPKTDIIQQGYEGYSAINSKAGARTPVETENLREMFMNATEFTQDLSSMWTRWTPPTGAFTDTQDRPWDNSANANTWFGTNLPSPYRTFNGRYLDNMIQNGHRYNSYAGQFTPTKSDCDVLYLDEYAIDFDINQQASYWHGIMTQPKDFATGANNFTSDKWPLWMTGVRETPMSTPELVEFVDSDTQRPMGATQYITCWPWTTEPYGWPLANWYQDGTY